MNPRVRKAMTMPTWVYVVCLIFFIYLFVQILSFSVIDQKNIVLSSLYFIEYGVHEVSHIAVMFLPSLLVAAAGSTGEVGLTLLVVIAALSRKAYFFAIFGMIWMMLALRSAGTYMADARTMALPLMGPGPTVKHDWNYVFGQLGLLPYDKVIGGTVTTIGIVIGAAGLSLGLYLIVRKIRTRHAKGPEL